jgi:hypothetical protein
MIMRNPQRWSSLGVVLVLAISHPGNACADEGAAAGGSSTSKPAKPPGAGAKKGVGNGAATAPAAKAATKSGGSPKRPKKPPTPSAEEAAAIFKQLGFPSDLGLSVEQRQRLGQVVAEHEPGLTATFKERGELEAENKRHRQRNGGRIWGVPVELDHPTYGLRRGLLDAKLKRQARDLRRDIRNLLTDKQRAKLPAESGADPTPLEKLEELIRTHGP